MPTPILTLVGWLAGTIVPPSCSSGNSPDFYNEATGQLFTCAGNVYVPVTGSGGTPISGGISTQSVVTGSRSFGTVFQNTTGKAMFVNVWSGPLGGSPSNTLEALTDASNPPTTVVNHTLTTDQQSIGFWVLPGNFYEVTSDNIAVVGGWIEWN